MQHVQPGKTKKKRIDLKKTGRWFKYKYLLLLRAKGGPSIVAMGFSIGLAIEMFTLPTGGLAFFLIFPLIYLFRASLAGALVGFVFGKVIYIPFVFLNKTVGSWVVPKHFKHQFIREIPAWLAHLLRGSLDLIVGGMIVGFALGLLLYFPVKFLLHYHTVRRKEKRKGHKTHLEVNDNSNNT